MIDKYLSDKIKVISAIAIILVLYIHSGFHDYPHEILGMKFNHLLQDFVSGKIGRCAVPLFYMISGFLFFQNINNGIFTIFAKIKKRIKTLLVPFIIACIFFPLFYIVLEFIPGTEKFINSGSFLSLIDEPLPNIITSLFYKVPNGTSPIAFQLWFLRDLIIVVAISPLLYYIRLYCNKIIYIILFFILNLTELNLYFPIFAVFWFMLGDFILDYLPKIKKLFIPFTYIMICVLEIYTNFTPPRYISIPITFIGIWAIWIVYDIIAKKDFLLSNHKLMSLGCSSTFFIYLYHEPTLNIIRKLLVVIFGKTSFSFAASYILSPWIFAAIAITIAYLMKRFIPQIYSILVGGR